MPACSAASSPSSGRGPERHGTGPQRDRALAGVRRRRSPVPRASCPARDLRDWRRASYARFVEQGIPTSRAEDWKYTNVVKAANVPLAVAPRAEIGLEAIAPYLLGGHKARRLIFVNGHVVPELSHVQSLPRGVRVMSLPRALQTEPRAGGRGAAPRSRTTGRSPR